MKFTDAYWINPKGKIIALNGTHIDYIMNNLSEFDLSKKDIEEYKKKNGDIYDGSKTRDELITKAMKDGWIRIRKHHGNGDSWTIQIYSSMKIPRTLKNHIVKFAEKMFANKKYRYDNVVVMNHKGNILFGGMGDFKDFEDIYLDDTGMFEKSKRSFKDYLEEK